MDLDNFDHVFFGTLVTLISLIGVISNGCASYFVATEPSLRHSTGLISVNTTTANFLYSLIFLLYVGPLMLAKKGFDSQTTTMIALSTISWFLFFVGQYFAFLLSLNRAIAVLFPLSYYHYVTIKKTIIVSVILWIFSLWHILFFALQICPGVYYDAVQNFLAGNNSGRACVDYLRVAIEMFLLIGLAVTSLLTDCLCAIRVMLNSHIRAKIKAADMQFLYQSLCCSLVLSIECFMAGYFVNTVPMSYTVYFLCTTFNRVLGRTISGMLVMCFHRTLRNRFLALFRIVQYHRSSITVVPQRKVTQPKNKSSISVVSG